MKCMFCGCTNSRVIDSRTTEESTAIRRRRECEQCGKRFTTYEKIEIAPLMVIKKDGRREEFNSEKIRTSILKACANLPVSMGTIDEIVTDIERKIANSLAQEVTSKQIGEMVMQALKDVDEVAYVRFASVYRQFRDIHSFMQELNKLLTESE
ncbi:MAG: transcriptional regulator NrdR [Christensenellales bacterium]|jgi:transcriptional repressor NrdR